MRCYKRICFAISKAAIGEHREWLSVIESDNRELAREAMAPAVLNPELHFVFGIGGLPLRFYKGSADEKTGKSLKRQYPEIHAFQFVMEFVDQPVYDRVLRLAVEIDDAGEVTGVVLVQLDKEGNPHNPWPIQLDIPVSKVVTPFRSTDKEKEIGAPPVGL
ncbi:MAG: hypothetical protein ACREMY_00600, partial [bacterium]